MHDVLHELKWERITKAMTSAKRQAQQPQGVSLPSFVNSLYDTKH